MKQVLAVKLDKEVKMALMERMVVMANRVRLGKEVSKVHLD